MLGYMCRTRIFKRRKEEGKDHAQSRLFQTHAAHASLSVCVRFLYMFAPSASAHTNPPSMARRLCFDNNNKTRKEK